MVGVFGAEMVVSFRSSGVELNVEIFGQFETLGYTVHVILGVVCVLGRFKMNCLNCY